MSLFSILGATVLGGSFLVAGRDTASLRTIAEITGRPIFADSGVSAPLSDAVRLIRVGIWNTADYDSYTRFSAGVAKGDSFAPVVSISANGTFSIPNVPDGAYDAITATRVPAGWWLRSAEINGRELRDLPSQVTSATPSPIELLLTFSAKHTEVSGKVEPLPVAPGTLTVVAFSADQALRRPHGWRIISTRADAGGAFSLRDVPPGEYFVAVVDTSSARDIHSLEFLKQLESVSKRLKVGEGETLRDTILRKVQAK